MGVSRRTVLRRTATVGGIVGVAGCLGLTADPAEALRSAAEEFDHLRELSTALDSGFRSRAAYVDTETGALGEVFVHERAHEVTTPEELDPHQPTLLFCRLSDDGRYEPLGVGWSIDEANVADAPDLFGQPFHRPDDHHVPAQAGYFGLHAWVFDDSVDDLFRPTHPSLDPPPFVDDLEVARSALGGFQAGGEEAGAEAAEDAGYENSEEHIFDEDGLYGVPFNDPNVDGIDLERPPILLYRMTDLWYYELLGAEWFVPTDEIDAPPSLFGQAFHDAMPAHSPHIDQPEHYGLHAWLYRANPAGMFALYNPRFR